MAIKLADVLIYLGATDDQLKSDLKSAEKLTDSWGSTVSTRLRDITRGAFERIGRMGIDMVIQGTKAAAGLVVESVNLAGDLSESINKVDVVFGESAGSIQEWSKTASTALGQSRQQALEAVGTFGNLFDSMGMSSDMTAEMSTSLVELASDLASFNNIDPAIALEKLRAGVVGEVEPLRTLGVNLSVVAVEAKAMQEGIVQTDVDMTKLNRATLNLEKANSEAAAALKEHGAESLQYREAAQKVAEAEAAIEKVMDGKKPVLTAAQKAQAAYALILEQTTNAQGDFERTSEGAANGQRILDAQIMDVKATIGDAFIPIWTELLIAMNGVLKDAMPQIAAFAKDTLGPAILDLIANVKEWVSWFMALDPATQGAILKTAGIVAVLVPLLGILMPVISAVTGLAGLFTTIAPIVSAAGGAIALMTGPIALVLAAIIGLSVAWNQNWFDIQGKTEAVTTAIGETLSLWWSDFKLGASSALDSVSSMWSDHDAEVQAIADTHWATLAAQWTTEWELLKGVSTAGVQFLSGDWDGGMATLRETAATFWENIKATFKLQLEQVKNIFAFFGWEDLGETIVQGIIDGVTGAGDWLADALGSTLQGAIDGVNNLFGGGSASASSAGPAGGRNLLGDVARGASAITTPGVNLAAAGVGGNTISVNVANTYNGQADEAAVRRGTEGGIVSAMRNLGLR